MLVGKTKTVERDLNLEYLCAYAVNIGILYKNVLPSAILMDCFDTVMCHDLCRYLASHCQAQASDWALRAQSLLLIWSNLNKRPVALITYAARKSVMIFSRSKETLDAIDFNQSAVYMNVNEQNCTPSSSLSRLTNSMGNSNTTTSNNFVYPTEVPNLSFILLSVVPKLSLRWNLSWA